MPASTATTDRKAVNQRIELPALARLAMRCMARIVAMHDPHVRGNDKFAALGPQGGATALGAALHAAATWHLARGCATIVA